MIYKQKKSKLKLLLILTGIMAVLIAGYFILVALLPEGGYTPTQKYEQLEWEGSSQRVFPDIDSASLDYITVNATEGSEHETFGLMKTEDGTFSLWYEPEKGKGNYREYRPGIVSADPAFTYSSLYAMDSFGQGKVARFFYLRSAVTTLYFTERISLIGLDDNSKRSYLEEFGFMDYGDYADAADDKELGVRVNYGKVNSETNKNVDEHVIWVGGMNVSGDGYYIILDDHPYIYAVNNNIGYATKPYTYYINPAVISAGLSSDAAYEPYLIADYQQWKNVLVSEKDTAITEGAEVIIKGETFLPKDHQNGGLISSEESITFDLQELSALKGMDAKSYQSLLRLLLSSKLTGIENPGADNETMPTLIEPIYITVASNGLPISFTGEKTGYSYTYKITAILAALTDMGDKTSGDVPDDAKALRVSYDLYIDGATEKSNANPLYAVLSLEDERVASVKDALLASNIGNVNIDLQIEYNKENFDASHTRTIRVYVSDIIAIYDKNGKSMTEITEDSIVAYRYYLEAQYLNDAGKVVVEKQDGYFTAADKVKDMDDANKALFLSLRVAGNGYNRKIGEYKEYLSVLKDFIAYRIDAIPYMIEKEEIVHFNFLNYSERDPFYGESIYNNTTVGKTLYGLNNSSCESVLLHLGGAGTSTNESFGYSGSETVAVGLTPEIMRKYGLYANTIYYKLPRGINGIRDEYENDDDVPDDYTWQNELGFTVYLSDRIFDTERGCYLRYMASDLYDVVVVVMDEKLDFVDLSFVDFWARRLLVSTDIDDLEEVDVEFNFDDLYGKFDFILDPAEKYNPDSETYVEILRMIVRPGANTSMNELVRFMTENGRAPDGKLLQSLVALYNRVGPEDLLRGGVSVVDNDYAATYFFKQTLGIMYTTMYLGTYTEAEQAKILAENPEPLMRITFALEGRLYKYTYEFYRASDRRMLVRIYQTDENGNQITDAVSDFAISTSNFKKIAGAFNTILNAGKVTGDEAFYDFSPALN